jgi:hypothetical protein
MRPLRGLAHDEDGARLVDPDAIRKTLYAAAKLRMPRFKPDTPRTERIEQLEDYLLQTAFHRGELEEARLYAHDALGMLLDQWDDLEGWQTIVGKSDPSQDAIRRAKKTLNKDIHDSLTAGKRLIGRLTDQIKRLEKDDEVASRAYTLIAGT